MKKPIVKQQKEPVDNTYEFDYLVFIGRFQPFHLGHEKVVKEALKKAERVIILIGSCYQPRSIRNPWSFEERADFINQSFDESNRSQLIIMPLPDDIYNDQNWLARVQHAVSGVGSQFPKKVGRNKLKVGLIGHDKDHSSYYLSRFPQWESVNVDSYKQLSSTPLRQQYFMGDASSGVLEEAFPDAVKNYLDQFKSSESYQQIAEEWQFIQRYKQGWDRAPYPPTFVTVDAVVVQSGHILLVERKASPGKGLLALPGGFLDDNEKLKDAVVRELKEETRIKVPVPVLAGSIVKEQVFDDPHRSSRGRTITHAFLIELKPEVKGLPKVKGGDDAKHAFWIPLGNLDSEKLFEDHFHIINAMLD